MPWLGTLFFVGHPDEPAPEGLPAGSYFLPDADLKLSQDTPSAPLKSMLHTVPLLSEHYLVFQDTQLPKDPLHPLDFFSPNGIPLIPSTLLAKDTTSLLAANNPLEALKSLSIASPLSLPTVPRNKPYPQTKGASALFWDFFAGCSWNEDADISSAYTTMLQQWLFLSSRGIPVPGA